MQTQQQFCDLNINNVFTILFKSGYSLYDSISLGFSIMYIKRMLGFTRAP